MQHNILIISVRDKASFLPKYSKTENIILIKQNVFQIYVIHLLHEILPSNI